MSQLGIKLVWYALEITPVLIAALVLSFLSTRRGPRASASAIRISLGVIAVLGLGNLLPGLEWRNLPTQAFLSRVEPQPAAQPQPRAPVRLSAARASLPLGYSSDLPHRLTRWQVLAHGVQQRLETSKAAGLDASLSELLAGAFVAVLGFACLHLLFGLWAVRRYRAHSRPIEEGALQQLLDRLRREIGCRQRVRLHESAHLATPATVGWRAPLVLLPSEWRVWDESERQAVLAHELAHIHHADYLAGLLARVSVMLHFYHPLVYWLTSRLYLQQELAADSLGARLGGGRSVYLRALAQMALRQERRSKRRLARTFLAFPSILFRRLTMLRAKESVPDQGLSLQSKVAVAVLLLLLGLGVPVLRGLALDATVTAPANPPIAAAQDNSEATTAAAQDNSEATSVEPFEITFVPGDALGVVALRPKELSERPSLKLAVKSITEALAEFQKRDGKSGHDLALDAMSQIIVKVQMPESLQDNGGYLSFLRPNLIRTVAPFDWKSLLQSTVPNLTEVHYLKKVYYRVTEPAEGESRELFVQLFGPFPCFYIPDNRTLVCESEKNIRQYLRNKNAKEEKGSWRENWKKVERNLLAIALENRNNRLGNLGALVAKLEAPETQCLVPFLQEVTSLVAGIAEEETFSVQVFANCKTARAAEQTAQAFGGALSLGRYYLYKALSIEEASLNPLLQALQELLQDSWVKREGTAVVAHGECASDLLYLAGLALLRNQ